MSPRPARRRRPGRRARRRSRSGGPRRHPTTARAPPGVPVTATSATVVAPPRPTSTSAAAYSRSIAVLEADRLVEHAARARPRRRSAGAGVALAHGVAHGEAGVVAMVGRRTRAIASLSTPEPSEPPITATTKRSVGSPRAHAGVVAAGRPVDGADRAAHRGAGDLGPRQRRAGVGHRAGGGEAGGDGARPARAAVERDDDDRDAQRGGRPARWAGWRSRRPRPPPAAAAAASSAPRPARRPVAAWARTSRLRAVDAALHADDVEERVRVRRRRQQLASRCRARRRRSAASRRRGRAPRAPRRSASAGST